MATAPQNDSHQHRTRCATCASPVLQTCAPKVSSDAHRVHPTSVQSLPTIRKLDQLVCDLGTWAQVCPSLRPRPTNYCLQPACSRPASRPASQPAGLAASQLLTRAAPHPGCHPAAAFSGNIFGQHFRAENFRPKLRPKTPPKDSTSRVKARPKMRSKTFVEKN